MKLEDQWWTAGPKSSSNYLNKKWNLNHCRILCKLHTHSSPVQAWHHITESAERPGPVGHVIPKNISPLQYITAGKSLHSQSAMKCSCGERDIGVISWSLITFRKIINYDVSAFSLLLSLGGGKITHIWDSEIYFTFRLAESCRKHIWSQSFCWLHLVFSTTSIAHHAVLSHFSLHFLWHSKSSSLFLYVPFRRFPRSSSWS